MLKWSVTNSGLIPAGAILTESKSLETYKKQAKEVFGKDDEDIASSGHTGYQSAETKFGRVGLGVVKHLMNRFMRIEYRVVRKPDRIIKYSIMFYFVLNDEDMHEAVPMSDKHRQALRWFALQTFEGCRIWNNGHRIVIDLVQRQPDKNALHYVHFTSTRSFCWAPLGEDMDPKPSPIHPQFLTQEFVNEQRKREEAARPIGERSLQRMFAKVDRAVAAESRV